MIYKSMFANTDLIDAVAQRRFNTLSHLEPVWDSTYDEPWYSTGKMGVVFKLKDSSTGQLYALKVFKERDAQKEERLQAIAEQISAYPSPYWTTYQFLADELRVESLFGDDLACVLLMEWIDGQTLGQYVKERCEAGDKASLYKLAYSFDQMALWLLANPFAHGDLKHDNIIITPKGTPVLVDYDGVYFPVFEGQQAFELGTPDYQHPQRSPEHYGPYLDDFSILVISLSLYALAQEPRLYSHYNTGENLILSVVDFDAQSVSELKVLLHSFNSLEVRQRLALMDYSIMLGMQNIPTLQYKLMDKIFYYKNYKKKVKILPNLIPYRNEKKWGYVNSNMGLEIDCIYDFSMEFVGEYAVVMKAGKWGWINKAKKEVVPCKYDDLFNASEGLARVKQGKMWGYLDKLGNVVIPFVYEEAYGFSEGLAPVRRAGLWGYLDKLGNVVIPFVYEEAYGFSEGLARVKQGKMWGYLDKLGNVVIPFVYEEAYGFSEGLAPVRRAGLWGFINKRNKFILNCNFEEIRPFSEGLAPVRQKGLWGYINKVGKLIIPFDYEQPSKFVEELASVQKNGKWGYINKEGKLIISFDYEEAYAFSGGIACVKSNGRLGYIDYNHIKYWKNQYF